MDSVLSYSKDAASFQKKIIFNAGWESSLDYANPKSSYSPKVSLLFSPFGLPFVPMEILGSQVGSIIKSIHWTKDRNNPGGVLSAIIAPNVNTVKDIFKIISAIPGGNLYTKIWDGIGYDLEDLFKPMTLCQLWIDGYHVMTGTVQSCHRSSSVGDDSYSVEYSLILNELGNIYTKNTVGYDTIMITNGLATNIRDSMSKVLNSVSNLKMVPVSMGIMALVNAFIGSTLLDQGMTVSDGFPLSMRLLALPSPVGAMGNLCYAQNMFVNANMFELQEQSFWDYMRNFIPTPWMEFFTESGGRTMVTEPEGVSSALLPGFNYVVARSTPYSNPLLGIVNPVHLPATFLFDISTTSMLIGGDFVIITDEDIHSKELGVDCANQATSFRTRYTAGAGTAAIGVTNKPIVSTGPLNPMASGGVGTFGFNQMVEEINCTQIFGPTVDMTKNIIAALKLSVPGFLSQSALSNLLAVWFRNQSRFREGSVTVKCKPWARAGMYCLYLPPMSGKKPENSRDIGIYYIDSLSHSYGLDDSSVSMTTTMTLIRGMPLPSTVAKAALNLFDYEVLPPMSGMADGELAAMKALRAATRVGRS